MSTPSQRRSKAEDLFAGFLIAAAILTVLFA